VTTENAAHTAADVVLARWPGEVVEVPGARLHVRRTPALPDREGTGVFIHGLGGAATNWTDLMGAFADRLECYAPDLPGFGRSEPRLDGDFSLAGHTDTVIAFIEHVTAQDPSGPSPVHLFGNSLGGAVATRVAALRPDLVRTLTLVSPALPSFRPRLTAAHHLPLLATPVLGDRLARKLARRTPEKQVADTMSLCWADPTAVPGQRLAEAIADAQRRGGLAWSQQALIRSLRGLVTGYLERGPGSLWAMAARVQAPTLLIYGMRDKLVDPLTSRRAARTFPDNRLVVLPDSGHVAQMEHPQIVARAVADLLAAAADRRR
jgi:pimeloyl-ACP methyl ester carboxylesterase